jgi:hypothetical protein
MRYYCNVCNETITENIYRYSMDHYGRALCITHQRGLSVEKNRLKKSTPQAIKLSNALTSRGIENELEYFDGFKHIDIAIPKAKLFLELDGSQHILSSKQLRSDIERDSHSHEAGFSTVRIRNDYIDRNLNKVTDNIVEICAIQYQKELGKTPSWFALLKKGLKKLSEYSYDLEEE